MRVSVQNHGAFHLPADIVREIIQFLITVHKNFAISKIILFGSFSKGNFHSWSDIDLAIVAEWQNMQMEERKNILLDTVLDSGCYRIQPFGITESELSSRNRDSFLNEILDGIEIYSNNGIIGRKGSNEQYELL